ncbi:adenine-specific DNA-methyltransferase [Saccharicrinis carchari]|uniref:site-specific DNA-methyltransferase (adenine-specific) n=1 Tax=Saccharicrinis carchari TaxID=1168039 RepID=A0A521DLD7_SACCC|nr:site-specific DNA-methyltransferase [Saccharicrinis carchari]SMO71750.1 adenine-specific DNA-methyltransferase [Saccharicrinis carchari]
MENIQDLMPNSHDWNKERLETLKQMFPDLFTNEGQLNINELKKVVDPSSVAETERYEFRWFGKSNAKRNAFTPSNATLIYDEQRSVNPTESENLIIEGENLEVLKLLSGSYREKIKCIYIDPPYNKDKDFVYKDTWKLDIKAYWELNGVFRDGVKVDTNSDTDGRYHSNWLNMMYSRLLISRQLLKEDGVIFISIDDTEIHHLRKMCDEVFGERNFLTQFSWRTDGNFDNQAKFKKCHEYIVVYAKNEELFPAPPVVDPGTNDDSKLFLEEIRNTIVKNGPKNPVSEVKLPIGFPSDIKNGTIDKREKSWPNYLNDAIITDGKLQSETIVKSGWSSKDLLIEFIENNCQPITDSKGQETKFVISNSGAIEVVKIRSDKQSHVITVLNGLGGPQKASAELEKIEVVFDGYPKPIELIQYFIKMNEYEEDQIFLDFFAGSGTLGHAMFKLNEEEGTNRRFILVQLPEATEANSKAKSSGFEKISDITIERNKRVVEKIIEEKKNKQPDLFNNGDAEEATKGLGFKVFKLTKSNFPRVEFAPDPNKTDEENIELFKKYISDKEAQLVTAFNRDELLTEILLKNNFTLNYRTEKQEQFKKNEILHVTDGEKETLICLDIIIDMETVEHFKTNTEQKFICLERALDTTKKYNLKHYMGDKFIAF